MNTTKPKLAQLSRSAKAIIRNEWIDIVTDYLLDDTMAGDLSGIERKWALNKKHAFMTKLNADIQEFGDLILDIKEQAVIDFIGDDEDDYLSFTDHGYYYDFCSYGGTECRLIWRAYFMVKGYKSFAQWGKVDSMDRHAISYYAPQWRKRLNIEEVA